MTRQIITVFRNRLAADATDEYAALSPHILALARDMPGFVDAKTFSAPDGERVTIVTFADQASHDAWRDQPEHRAAQRRGIEAFYDEYSIQVAAIEYERRFTRQT
ncbi:MAG: antibiotic biosynthesis monooxygenase [Actinobacteria bacterium]|nr:antibiotic biosynthesis monooxygenase [Actinomycetota bacterium]